MRGWNKTSRRGEISKKNEKEKQKLDAWAERVHSEAERITKLSRSYKWKREAKVRKRGMQS